MAQPSSSVKSLEEDLRSIMLGQGQTAATAATAATASKVAEDGKKARSRGQLKQKSAKKSKKAEMSIKKRRAALKDPELYHALMRECSKEEMTPPNKDYVAPPFVTQYLVLNDVRPLKKKSQKFPKAQYYCRLCDYHCDTLTICISHIKDVRHSRLARMQEIETTLYHLPKPTRQHLDHLEQLLSEVEKEVGLSPSDLAVRQEMTSTLNEVIQLTLGSEVSVRLFGSSLSGFGLKTASIDLGLALPSEGIKQHEALTKAAEIILSRKDLFSKVRTDFSARYPKIFFDMTTRNPSTPSGTTQHPNLPCELSLNNHNAVQCSKLLRDYMTLDPRVRTLGVCVKYWAHLCQLDLQEEGTLAPHSFPILLVFFLQQETKPVLPCIHDWLESRTVDVYEPPTEKLSAWKSRSTKSRSELFVEFFDFYALEFRQTEYVVSLRQVGGVTKEEKLWRGKKLILEDPFVNKRSLTRGVSSPSILDFVNDCFKIGFLYFGTVQTNQGPVITKILVPDISPDRKGKKTEVEDATIDHDDENSISTENSERSKNDEPNKAVSELMSQLKLGTPSENATPTGAPPTGNTNAISSISLPANAIKLEELEQTFEPSTDKGGELSCDEVSSDELSDDDDDELSDDESDDMQPNRRGAKKAASGETFESFLQRHGKELTPKQAKRVTELVPKNMILFRFDGDILTAGQRPPFVCTVCQSEEHLQSACPDEVMPPKRPLPAGGFPPNFLEAMNGMAKEVMLKLQPSNEELRDRRMILEDLARFIKKFWPKAVLTVFGSSQNGFSFRHSDLDLSLTFSDHKTSEDLDAIEIIEQLAEKMKRMKGIRQIQAITSAKVPIIKFIHYSTHTEGDISLYNVLAQENTAMLRMYSNIDQRVKVLGYMAKNLAKRCDIGDASRGSLSSYAYILMLLHYLQQCEPPVIPCLQELDNADGKKENLVDGWNAWYFCELDRVNQAWTRHPTRPGRVGGNKESVTELWIGFLSYYAYDFDDKNLVVSTRMTRKLTKFEKMWNLPTLAIEDPFDLGHNLGGGLHRRMNIYIKKVFMKARERFGIPPMQYPRGYQTPLDYLWDQHFLVDGPLPNDRGCRSCGKIGHLVRDCPRKRQNDEQRKQRLNQQRQRTLSERSNESTPTKQGKKAQKAAEEAARKMKPLVEVREPGASKKQGSVVTATAKAGAKGQVKAVEPQVVLKKVRDLVNKEITPVKKGKEKSKKEPSPTKKVAVPLEKTNKTSGKVVQSLNNNLSPREKKMVSNMAKDSHLTSLVKNYTQNVPTPFFPNGLDGKAASAKAKKANKPKAPVVQQPRLPLPKAKKPVVIRTSEDSSSAGSTQGEKENKRKNYWKERKAKAKAQKEEKREAKKEKGREGRKAEKELQQLHAHHQQLMQQQLMQQQLVQQLHGMMPHPPPMARPPGPPPPQAQGQAPNLMALLGIGGQGQSPNLPPPSSAPPTMGNPLLHLQNIAPPPRTPSCMPPMPHFPAGAMSVDQLEASMGVPTPPKRQVTPPGSLGQQSAPPPGFVGGGGGGGVNIDELRKIEALKQQLGVPMSSAPPPIGPMGGLGLNAFGVSPNGRPTLSPFPGLMGGAGGQLGGLGSTPPNPNSSLGLGGLSPAGPHPFGSLGLGGGLGLGLGAGLGGVASGRDSLEEAFRSQTGLFGNLPQNPGGFGLGLSPNPQSGPMLDLDSILRQNPQEKIDAQVNVQQQNQGAAPGLGLRQNPGNPDDLGIPEDSLLRRHWQP